jgi:RHS repeat-associated protein
MITWKNFAADSGKAITAWRYDTNRGFLISKAYDDGKGTTNTYTPAGRLRTRTWARGVVTTYHTNAAGEVFATTYSDSTPAVTNNFDRLGRSTNIIDGAGSRFLVYNSTGQLLGETNSSGALIGANLRFAYDQYFRRTNHAWYATNTSLLSHSFVFDGASRITNVTDGTYQSDYSYLANSPLISQVNYRSNSTTRMTTTKSYDFLNRLTSISSQPSASGLASIAFNYSYNDANQRVRVNMADGSFWIYEYDKLGQVISGKCYWSDWTPVAGQQYEYAFDDIGNRTTTKAGGDANGADLRTSLYSANALNQYTSHYVPPYLNVLGIAHANASVTVNSQSPYRRGEYFWKELSVDNSSAAVWQSITNIASLTGTNQTNTGNLFLPATAGSPTYDADGNLTSDGRWTNKWDAENRLIDMTSHASGPSGSRKSLQFAYDSQGRRYSKVVSNWTGSAWTRALHELYLYDGWNLLGALDGTNNAIIRSFLWGLDLSGSLQGAGGVGGLICFKQHSGSSAGTHFSAYDGNGNVMALVDGKTGSASARYEYDPFGQTIRASGTMATLNPVRFSSKCVDEESDFSYYGYRYLNPNIGRWLGRDPIDEQDGPAIYVQVRNSAIGSFDAHGLCLTLIPLPGRDRCLLHRYCWFSSMTVASIPPAPNCRSKNMKRTTCNYTCSAATLTSVFGGGGCAAVVIPGPPFTISDHCVDCGWSARTCADEIEQYRLYNAAGVLTASRNCVTENLP